MNSLFEKNKFSTPAKPRPNGTSYKSNTIIKVAQFNKLRSAVLLRPRICTTLFQMEFTELPESHNERYYVSWREIKHVKCI